jgi:hypothetical protein
MDAPVVSSSLSDMHVHARWLQFLLFMANKYHGESTPYNAATVARRMVETCGLVRSDHSLN